MNRPVILVAIKGLGIGGAEKLVAESARFWDRSRFDYRVAYALPWKDQLVGALEDLGIPVRCIGTRRGMTPTSWMRLRRFTTSAALVHAHLPAMGAMARIFSRSPVIYTEHNVASSYRAPVRLVNRATYSRNRVVTAVSAAVADSVSGYPGPAARVVPNGVAVGVAPGAAARVRAILGTDPQAPLVVHVGNIRPHKGHGNLVDAIVHLTTTHPKVTVVSIGGEKHPGDLERVRARAVAARVADRIRFLGRREDALDFIAAADVFANPSDHEGLPVALLEAMALARPVVATAVGGVPGLIVDDETGVLVPGGDPKALASGIGAMLDNPHRAARLGVAAAKVVERHYSLEAMVRTFEAMYAEVLGG